MPAATLISVEEYLRTPFPGPEPDYVDGVLLERSMPSNSHSRVIRNIGLLLLPWDQAGELVSRTEIRLRVAPGRYRVADLAYFNPVPVEEIPEHAPVVIFEALSPDDSHDDLMRKLADYQEAGVRYVFVANPRSARLLRYRNGSLIDCPALEIPEYGIQIPLSEIFK